MSKCRSCIILILIILVGIVLCMFLHLKTSSAPMERTVFVEQITEADYLEALAAKKNLPYGVGKKVRLSVQSRE